MKSLGVHEAKAHFSKLLDRAHAGEEIVITKRGKAHARLVPLQPLAPRTPGLLSGVVDAAFFDALPETESEAWEGSPTAKMGDAQRERPKRRER